MNPNGSMETTAVVLSEPSRDILILPDRGTLQRKLAAVRDFQTLVKSQMIHGHDYGQIPGTDKPTLLKPGAEKIAKLLELADTYETTEQTLDWDRPFFHFLIRCRLVVMGTTTVVSEGLGECNSYEGKYRYRWVFDSGLPAGLDKATLKTRTINLKRGGTAKQYQVENEDIFSQVNTLLKMAKKRALVDAALSAGRLSDIFTQDMEDLAPEPMPEATPPAAPPRPTPPRPPSTADPEQEILGEIRERLAEDPGNFTPPPTPDPERMPSAEEREAYARGLEKARGLTIDTSPYAVDGKTTRAELIRLGQQLKAAIEAQEGAQPALV